MKLINKQTIIAALVGGVSALALTAGGVALAHGTGQGGPHGKGGPWNKEMPRGKEKFVAMKDLRFATEDQIYANLSCEQRDELRLLKREHKVERMQQRFERHQGDLTLLEQALGNLVQNAVRYNHSGGHIAVVLRGHSAAWSLEVVDDGPGIPEAERERVLEPSFRGSEARTRHPHGMGLGLHIVSDVAGRHGLALTLSETDGGGLSATLRPRRDT